MNNKIAEKLVNMSLNLYTDVNLSNDFYILSVDEIADVVRERAKRYEDDDYFLKEVVNYIKDNEYSHRFNVLKEEVLPVVIENLKDWHKVFRNNNINILSVKDMEKILENYNKKENFFLVFDNILELFKDKVVPYYDNLLKDREYAKFYLKDIAEKGFIPDKLFNDILEFSEGKENFIYKLIKEDPIEKDVDTFKKTLIKRMFENENLNFNQMKVLGDLAKDGEFVRELNLFPDIHSFFTRADLPYDIYKDMLDYTIKNNWETLLNDMLFKNPIVRDEDLLKYSVYTYSDFAGFHIDDVYKKISSEAEKNIQNRFRNLVDRDKEKYESLTIQATLEKYFNNKVLADMFFNEYKDELVSSYQKIKDVFDRDIIPADTLLRFFENRLNKKVEIPLNEKEKEMLNDLKSYKSKKTQEIRKNLGIDDFSFDDLEGIEIKSFNDIKVVTQNDNNLTNNLKIKG